MRPCGTSLRIERWWEVFCILSTLRGFPMIECLWLKRKENFSFMIELVIATRIGEPFLTLVVMFVRIANMALELFKCIQTLTKASITFTSTTHIKSMETVIKTIKARVQSAISPGFGLIQV